MAVFESKLHGLVINAPSFMLGGEDDSFAFKNLIYDFLDEYYQSCEWLACVHDKDVKHHNIGEDEIEFKTIHCHIVLRTPRKVKTNTIVNDFNEFVNVSFYRKGITDYKNLVSDSRIWDLALASRYLLHLDDPDKHRYSSNELFYSDESVLAWLDETDVLTYDNLVKLVESSECKLQIMARIGLEKYNHLYKVIDLVWDEVKRKLKEER